MSKQRIRALAQQAMTTKVPAKVSRESAMALEQIAADLTRLHLAEVGHEELWGAISVAQAALHQCWFIANRDRES